MYNWKHNSIEKKSLWLIVLAGRLPYPRIYDAGVLWKNEGFREVAYLNMIEIFLIFAQKSPKKGTFGQKSGGLFKFYLNFPVVVVCGC